MLLEVDGQAGGIEIHTIDEAWHIGVFIIYCFGVFLFFTRFCYKTQIGARLHLGDDNVKILIPIT